MKNLYKITFLLILASTVSCQENSSKSTGPHSEGTTPKFKGIDSPPKNKALKEFDQLVEENFVADETCERVFTGNAGDYSSAKVSYARVFAYSIIQDLCSEDKSGSVLDIFQQPSMGKKDALSLEQFNRGSTPSKSIDNLIATYSLTYSLGQRESDGNFSEGRDLSANNTDAIKEEAGLIQVSANSLNLKGTLPQAINFLRSVFFDFVTNLSSMGQEKKVQLCLSDKLHGPNESKKFDLLGNGLHELFETGDCKNLESALKTDYKLDDKIAGCFRNLNKKCPSFAVKYGAGVARIRRDHNGPLILHEEFPQGVAAKYLKPYLVPSCHSVFKAIAKLDLNLECKKLKLRE